MTNYNLLVEKINKIASYANDMQNYMLEACFKTGGMVNLWKKDNYNYYVKFYNAIIPVLNEFFIEMVSYAPDKIYAKIRSYAKLDNVNIVSDYSTKTAIILKDIPESNIGVEDIDKEILLQKRGEIVDQLSKAKHSIDEILEEVKSVEWSKVNAIKSVEKLVNWSKELKKLIDMIEIALDIQMYLQAPGEEDNINKEFVGMNSVNDNTNVE